MQRGVGDLAMSVSTGTLECMHWKGVPLFKTVYEFSLYFMMLWEIRPATVIELGSGAGGSAILFSDILKLYNNPAHVYSVDIIKPGIQYDGVTFIEGDIFAIDDFAGLFENLPKPWLVIEDAHVNVDGVLRCMHNMLQTDDYLIVEDSSAKQKYLQDFMMMNGDYYRVDTRYIDFFGTNVTSAQNSVFKRVASGNSG